MFKHKYKIIGIVAAILLWLLVTIFDLELFETMVKGINELEDYEIDEIFFSILLLLGFLAYDQFKQKKDALVELEKRKIFDAMLGSSNHIINNFMNQMQLFKITAKRTKDFPEETLALYDDIISDTKKQLQALGELEKMTEESIRNTVAPKKARKQD